MSRKWRWCKWVLSWIKSRLLFPASSGECFFTSSSHPLVLHCVQFTWPLTAVCNSTESAPLPLVRIVSPAKREEFERDQFIYIHIFFLCVCVYFGECYYRFPPTNMELATFTFSLIINPRKCTRNLLNTRLPQLQCQ